MTEMEMEREAKNSVVELDMSFADLLSKRSQWQVRAGWSQEPGKPCWSLWMVEVAWDTVPLGINFPDVLAKN